MCPAMILPCILIVLLSSVTISFSIKKFSNSRDQDPYFSYGALSGGVCCALVLAILFDVMFNGTPSGNSYQPPSVSAEYNPSTHQSHNWAPPSGMIVYFVIVGFGLYIGKIWTRSRRKSILAKEELELLSYRICWPWENPWGMFHLLQNYHYYKITVREKRVKKNGFIRIARCCAWLASSEPEIKLVELNENRRSRIQENSF